MKKKELLEYLESIISYQEMILGHLYVINDHEGAEFVQGGITDVQTKIDKLKK